MNLERFDNCQAQVQVQVPGQVQVRSRSGQDFEGDFEGYFKGSSRGCLKGTSKGTSNRTWKGTCCQAQVKYGPGQALPRSGFSFELDSEVGQLVTHL